jgi:hypothetical protein
MGECGRQGVAPERLTSGRSQPKTIPGVALNVTVFPSFPKIFIHSKKTVR